MRLLNRVGENCQVLLDQHMRGFHCRLIQVDEIWTFCRKKEQRLTHEERNNPELGDQYVFTALDADLQAVEDAFGTERDYAQLVKLYGAEPAGFGRYAPPRVTEVISTKINGDPDERFISTSYVERHNLTLRMQVRRFTRLIHAFSKKLANLKAVWPFPSPIIISSGCMGP